MLSETLTINKENENLLLVALIDFIIFEGIIL